MSYLLVESPCWTADFAQECDPNGVPLVVASRDGTQACWTVEPQSVALIRDDMIWLLTHRRLQQLGFIFWQILRASNSTYYIFNKFTCVLHFPWRSLLVSICFHLRPSLCTFLLRRVQQALEASNVVPTCLFAMKDRCGQWMAVGWPRWPVLMWAGLRRHLRPGLWLLAGGQFQPRQVPAVQLSERVPSHQCALLRFSIGLSRVLMRSSWRVESRGYTL